MDSRRLRYWKDDQIQRAADLRRKADRRSAPLDLRFFYPELRLSEHLYTTSLDPRVPLWQLLPFFETVVVGVLPALRDEAAFLQWYGVTPKQLLWLHDIGRVQLRILFPHTRSSVPAYLDAFFERLLPSTIRDSAFTATLLGDEATELLKERFRSLTRNFSWEIAIDGLRGDRARARRAAETAYLQLHSLGYATETACFDALARRSPFTSRRWLEACRLLCVGPVHYSLGGVHSLPQSLLTDLLPKSRHLGGSQGSPEFPSELATLLIEFFKLYSPLKSLPSLSLEEVVDLYPSAGLANRALSALHGEVTRGRVSVNTLGEMRDLAQAASGKYGALMRGLRILASTGIAAASLPLCPAVGLLAGLGFEILSEVRSKPLDVFLAPVAKAAIGGRHLVLLVELQADLQRRFLASVSRRIGR